MAGILGQAYAPLTGYQGEVGSLLSKSSAPQLPQRPGIPQVAIRAPDYLGGATSQRQRESAASAANEQTAVGAGTALASTALLIAILH